MCSCTPPAKLIKIEQEQPDTYTNRSLSRFIAQNPKAAVVVRDPNAVSGGVSSSSRSNMVCNLIERALMQKGYNPRDRKMFESVVSKMGDNSDYSDIAKKTNTELLFEVTHFSLEDEYPVNSYYQNTAKMPLTTFNKSLSSVTFMGFSIEIKVVLLQDNLIGGTYKYYYTPCAAPDGGCKITSYNKDTGVLYYLSPKSDKEETLEGSQKSESAKKETRDEKWSKQLGQFISSVVIPDMFKRMNEQVNN